MQKFLRRLERFSQSLLSPLSYLSAAGLLLVLGALLTSKPLCQALPVLQWAPLQLVGQLLYNGMMVLINNLSVILCVGVAAVRAKTEKQDAALLALMAYLVFLTANHTALEALGLLAQPNGMTGLAGTGQTTILGIQVVDTGVASGIVLGIAAAFIFTARKENRARTAAAMIPLAVTASVASITEPIDFLFCFVSPLLWVAHAVITGGFMVLLHVLHVRAFTSNLLGSLVFNLSAGEQLQNMPLLYLLGFAEILTYFAVFSVLIKAKDLSTPGREAALSADQSPYADPQEVCQFIAALGGPENIAQLGNCFTRLRLTVRDASLLDMGALLSLPHKGLVVQGTRVQLVCGLHAAQLRHALEQQLAEMAPV